MTDFNYKKYSLEKLEEWMHDCMSSGEASPQEVYDTIVNVVKEQYNYYKDGASRTDKLLELLNRVKTLDLDLNSLYGNDDYITFNTDPAGNQVDFLNLGVGNTVYSHTSCEAGDMSDYCNNSWNDFWLTGPPSYYDDVIPSATQKDMDKVVKWQLPVQQACTIDNDGEYFVNFPDDLLEAANLKEGDVVEWVDNNNGTYTLRKVNVI
jgi:hypothetical protein